MNVGPPVNTSAYDTDPGGLSSDGLEFYFDSKRAGSLGEVDIYVTRREARDAPWGEPVNLGPTVNTSVVDAPSGISTNGLTLFIYDTGNFGILPRPGGTYDIWTTTRATNVQHRIKKQTSNTENSTTISFQPF